MDAIWQVDQQRLYLGGRLDRETLLPLWEQRETLMRQIYKIDISALEWIDSAGLALLIRFCQIARSAGKSLVFEGATERLRSLVSLYNLHEIIVC